MNKLKRIILAVTLVFFTACGIDTNVNPNLGFDMWDYMSSSRNYEVEYDIYENGFKTDYYIEAHRQFGTQYERKSVGGLTTLFLSFNNILMREPNNSINIIRFLQLGDRGIFQSPNIQLCTLERFYNVYQNKGLAFYNVIQVSCTLRSGVYQEFYYAYNEGIVTTYEENNGFITEYVKRKQSPIF